MYLPFSSPSMPPLGIPLLASFLKKEGYALAAYDLNIELFHLLLSNAYFENGVLWYNKLLDSVDMNALFKDGTIIEALNLKVREKRNRQNYESALNIFTRKTKLANSVDLYKYSDVINSILKTSTICLPFLSRNPSTFNITLPLNMYTQIEASLAWAPILKWLYGKLDTICQQTKNVGFSLCYANQVHFFLIASSYIRKKYPNIKIIAGGPIITGILKGGDINIPCSFLEDYQYLVDYAIVEDGEIPLKHLLKQQEHSQIIMPPFSQYVPIGDEEQQISYCVPDFNVLPLDQYLTPALTLPIITCRHCYWGKCYFCSHSIGYRNFYIYKPDEVINALNYLSVSHHVHRFYLVDECTSPKMAKSIADWIFTQKKDIIWMAEMRFELVFKEKAYTDMLYNGGCRYIAFGFESASERVLEKMNKGITADLVATAINNCYLSNIKVNLMFFFGFPSETKAEAEKTFNFIVEHSNKIAGIGMCAFTLTPQSYVFRHYEKFDITSVSSDGTYVNTTGLSQSEALAFLESKQNEVKKLFYRGHIFYHRTFYLIDFPKTNIMNYPLGFTRRSVLMEKIIGDKLPPIQQLHFNEVVLTTFLHTNSGEKVVLLLNDSIPDNTIMVLSQQYFNQLISSPQYALQQLSHSEIEKMWRSGVIRE